MSVATGYHLPTTQAVRELIEGLLAKTVTVAQGTPVVPGPATPASVGAYADDRGQLVAVSCADLALACHAGAALGLVPPAQSELVRETGVLDDTLAENFYEVLNIMASLFNVPGAEHLRLLSAHHAGETIPPPVRAHTLTLGRRLDLSVEVAGYGRGRLSLVLSLA